MLNRMAFGTQSVSTPKNGWRPRIWPQAMQLYPEQTGFLDMMCISGIPKKSPRETLVALVRELASSVDFLEAEILVSSQDKLVGHRAPSSLNEMILQSKIDLADDLVIERPIEKYRRLLHINNRKSLPISETIVMETLSLLDAHLKPAVEWLDIKVSGSQEMFGRRAGSVQSFGKYAGCILGENNRIAWLVTFMISLRFTNKYEASICAYGYNSYLLAGAPWDDDVDKEVLKANIGILSHMFYRIMNDVCIKDTLETVVELDDRDPLRFYPEIAKGLNTGGENAMSL